MQRRALAMLVLALLLAAVPTAAQAKGASAATISGGGPGGLPGGPIDLKGDGEPGSGTSLSNLAEAAGVFALLWEDGQPGALTSAPLPPAQRGARYTITWTFPNGDGGEDQVRQSVWPYAAGGPLTFMGTGQKVLDGTTKGGWYRAGDNLRQLLVTLGLPDRAPLATPTPAPPAASPAPAAEPSPALWPKVAGVVALLLAVTAATALIRRRRSTSPGPAPTH
jgi:hypothetical protein